MKVEDFCFKANDTDLIPIDIEVYTTEAMNYVIMAKYACDFETYMSIENVLTLGNKKFIKLGYKDSIFTIREKF